MRFLKHITALLACYLFCLSGHAVPLRRQPGKGIPEYILPTDRDNPALWSSSPRYLFTRSAAPGDYALADIPRTGAIEYPLVLVQFKDLHFITKDTDKLRERYERLFNEHGYNDTARYEVGGTVYYGTYGSVSDYFRDQSFGKYIPTFKIIGPITVSQGYAYYGGGKYDNVEALVREVCDSIVTNNLANLAGYARNGVIDQISVIYAGRGENYDGSDPNTIWPQASELYFSRTDSRIYNAGIRRAKYACSSELFWNTDSILDGIGTFCHEFSHTLGLPDFYDTGSQDYDLNDAAMGFWSLMDYGCYEDGGFSPVGYTAFEKYSLGWLDLEEITNQGVYLLNDISNEPAPGSDTHTAYRLSTGNDDQYIILESHSRHGWYKYHRSEGLMVTTVDYNSRQWNNNSPNSGTLKRYRILPADNNFSMYSNDGDLFPYTDSLGNVTDSITTLGKPELKAGSSYPSLSVYNIRKEGTLVTFYAGYELQSGIKDAAGQEVSINITDGGLSITSPSGSIVTIHDISGKAVSEIITTEHVQQITLPGRGIWIVKCGNKTRKVRF